jgi:hypothetical protein
MSRRCDWVNQIGTPCGQPLGHVTGHGNGLLTTPRDTWHQFMGTTDAERTAAVQFEKVGVIWTEHSLLPRCGWASPTGRCIYELAHTLPHREEIHYANHD